MLALDWDFEISSVAYIMVYKDLCDPRPDIVCHFIDKVVVPRCNLGEGSSFRRVSCEGDLIIKLVSFVATRCSEMMTWKVGTYFGKIRVYSNKIPPVPDIPPLLTHRAVPARSDPPFFTFYLFIFCLFTILFPRTTHNLNLPNMTLATASFKVSISRVQEAVADCLQD